MKKTLLLAAVALTMGAAAQAQTNVQIWKGGKATVAAMVDSITFAEPAPQPTLDKKGLLITEIFYGSYPKRKNGGFANYKFDQYFKIGNNSNHTQYLDGICLVETKTETDLLWNIVPHDGTTFDTNANVLVQAIYQFPGTGKDYPVRSGQEIVIALNGRNHRIAANRVDEAFYTVGDSVYAHNADSVCMDLSKAKFEIYDAPAPGTPEGETKDYQNDDVEDMIKWYNSSKTIWVVSQQGNLCYGLVKIPAGVTKDSFLKDNYLAYDYWREWEFGDDGKLTTKNQEAYIMPTEWFIDAVNVAHTDEPVGYFLPQTLDAGWTYIGDYALKTRRDKAIIRKKLNSQTWVDTNNSTNDFRPATTASMRYIKPVRPSAEELGQ